MYFNNDDRENNKPIIRFFKTEKYWKVVVDLNEVNPYSYVDLSGITQDNRYACVENKNKSFGNDKYGDIIIDYAKYQKYCELKEYDMMLAVNCFNDGTFAIADADMVKNGICGEDYYIEWKWMPTSTDFKENQTHNYEWQLILHLRQQKLYDSHYNRLAPSKNKLTYNPKYIKGIDVEPVNRYKKDTEWIKREENEEFQTQTILNNDLSIKYGSVLLKK